MQLKQLIKLAEELEENTPFSFNHLDQVKSLFIKQTPDNLKNICVSL